MRKLSHYSVDWFIKWLLLFIFLRKPFNRAWWTVKLTTFSVGLIHNVCWLWSRVGHCWTEGTSRSELNLKRTCLKLPLCQFVPPCSNFPKLNLIWVNTENNSKSGAVKPEQHFSLAIKWCLNDTKCPLNDNSSWTFLFTKPGNVCTCDRLSCPWPNSKQFLFICSFASELSHPCGVQVILWSGLKVAVRFSFIKKWVKFACGFLQLWKRNHTLNV